ncbi:MAG: S41 family peptidase [Bacteroidales bacterium]|nr:S41 family peptidase [Bacteroidales bacterium]MCF8456393.1 S41 family peptidase [Bacteroidales bacterium]
MEKQNKKWVIIMPIILALMLVVGIYIGNGLKVENESSQFFIYPQTNKLNALLNYIEEEYVDSVSKNKLIEGAIPVILEELDPHSVYIPAEDLQETNESLQGNFDGIGIEFNILTDTVIVINTIVGGPSEKVGLMAGDRIVMVDDSLIAGIGLSSNDVVKLLKGPGGTKVKVGIMRKNEPEIIDFEIIRDKIPMFSVDVAYMVDDSTGYLKMSKFSKNTYEEFIDAIKKLKAGGMQNLILDLRGNGGGFLDVAVNISNEFLDAGKLIVYHEGKARPKRESFSNANGMCINNKLVVLIDEQSASASEILAGALQDNDRGIIVGRRSFGKGLVQEQTQFPDGSALRLTVARYYTPTGRCIQRPYGNGTFDYYHEVVGRFEQGEFYDADSIRVADSLKYFTPKGKVVYGGGGIIPDIFVPVDTSGISDYFTRVRNRGYIYQFAFDYADQHREKLSEFKNYKELAKYLKRKKLLNEFVAYTEKKGVKGKPDDIRYSTELINTLIIGQIVRNIFNDEGFYPIIQDVDMTLKKAIEIIELEK